MKQNRTKQKNLWERRDLGNRSAVCRILLPLVVTAGHLLVMPPSKRPGESLFSPPCISPVGLTMVSPSTLCAKLQLSRTETGGDSVPFFWTPSLIIAWHNHVAAEIMLCFQVIWVRSYLFKALGPGYILTTFIIAFTLILALSPFRRVFTLAASCSSHRCLMLLSLSYFSSVSGTVILCRKWSLSHPFHAPVGPLPVTLLMATLSAAAPLLPWPCSPCPQPRVSLWVWSPPQIKKPCQVDLVNKIRFCFP